MVKVYEIDGVRPVIHPSAYVHPSAVLVGDVIIGPRCYVGPLASIRGDFGRLILEEGANLQDTCVMHGFPGDDTVVEVTATSAMARCCTAAASAAMRWSA
jgi:phenylacetic acid degradation protein